MNRTYFAALFAWIICALIVMASALRTTAPLIAAPPVAATQPTTPASPRNATVLRPARLLLPTDARPPAPTAIRGSTADSIKKSAVIYAERAFPDGKAALAPHAAATAQHVDISRADAPAAVLGSSSSFDLALNGGRLARFSR